MMGAREFWDTAEKEAVKTWGREHKDLILAVRSAPFFAGLLAAGATGWGAWWLWDRARTALAGSGTAADGGGFPVWLIVVLLTAGVATLIVGRAVLINARFATVALTFAGLAIVWLGLIAFAVGSHS